jgi:hypothetical protein
VITTILKTSPVGTAEPSPGRSPGLDFEGRPSPAGTADNGPRRNPGQPFSRPCGTRSCCMMYPGLASWARFSRPCGTDFGNRVLTHALKPSSRKAAPFVTETGQPSIPGQNRVSGRHVGGTQPSIITVAIARLPVWVRESEIVFTPSSPARSAARPRSSRIGRPPG